jgi:hypothetical protein
MKNILLFIFISCFFSSICAQDIYNINQEENKFVYGESIKLFIGDSLYVEAKIVGDFLRDYKVVDSITDPTITLIIKFTYDNFGMHKASILSIKNPFDRQLNYKAKIKVFNRNRFYETSIMPILPKILSIEMWPDKLESIILYDFILEKN